MTAPIVRKPTFPAPAGELGLIVQVTWLDSRNQWDVWLTKHYSTVDGAIDARSLFQGKYGVGEAPTAYQAMMLGLSDWRKSR